MDFSNESRNLQIGNYLQTLRLEQDLTLEQLSILSQVPIVHLTSIEEGRFSRFDSFYLKMYLKRYTQSLDVDLEQLYTYASQQPLPDLPKNIPDKQPSNERQMTQTQADISAIPKNVTNTKPQRRKTTVKATSIARLEAKKKVGKFVISFAFIVLLIVLVIFLVTAIRSLGDREPSQTEPPPIVDNPHDMNLGTTDEESDDPYYEEESEPEPEPEITDTTTVELYSHVGNTHTFTVVTSLEDVELRIEHSGANWIGGYFNGAQFTNHTYHDLLEENFELSDNDVIRFTAGAANNIVAIFINDEEVDFAFGLEGVHIFVFNIESE